MEESS